MCSVHFGGSSRIRSIQGLAWVGFLVIAAVPALTDAQETLRPNARHRPAGLRGAGTYEYGFDPYDGKMESRGYAAQGYSSYAERFYTRPRVEIAPLVRPVPPAAGVYGYVEPEVAPPAVGREGPPMIFGYYYDPESGDLQYGWHETTAAPAAREEAPRARAWRAREETQPPPRPQEEMEQFRGQVVDLSTYTDRNTNRIHLVARIRQSDGTLNAVELGPFSTSTVTKGDWLEGFGPRVILRGGPMILARHVAVNGVWEAVNTPTSSDIRTFAGEILRLRTVPLSGRPGEQAIADVRLGTNNIETVILGPASAISEQTRFAAGDQIAFWARPGTLDGLPVLVATQIDLGTRVLNITGTSVDSRSEDLLVPVE